MKKKVFILAVLAVLFAVLVMHVAAFCDFQRITAALADMDECQISVTDYSAGSSPTFEVVDTAVAEELCRAAAEIQYHGIFGGREVIAPADHAYALIISSGEFHVVFELSGDADLARMNGNIFKISIRNYDKLYGLLEQITAS